MTLRTLPRVVIASAVLGALLSACSSGGDDAVTTEPTATLATTVTTTPLSSTTTSEPTTTATPLDDEAAVRAVHTRFMTELQRVDERANGPEAILPIAEEITTGPLLARIKEGVQRSIDTGERSVGSGYESNIVDVLIEGDTASVLDCSRDTGVLYSADGNVLTPAATEFKMRETRLVRIDDRWMVDEFVGGGDVSCDPDA